MEQAMKSPDQIIEAVVKKEGGYVNNPNDKGGETNYGITIATARANGYNGAMRDLPLAIAVSIYKTQYWNKPKYNEVYKLAPKLAAELFDMGVNMGPSVGSKALQELLNLFNRRQKLYSDYPVKSDIDTNTLSALNAFLKARGKDAEKNILKALICYRGNRYIEITKNREGNEEFFYGWIANRIELVE